MALRSVQGVDRTGLYLQLEAAIDTVDHLTGNAPGCVTRAGQTQAAPGTVPQHPDATGQPWQRLLASLSQVVQIRRLDERVKPLLSPQQSVYARLNLRLTLQEAETALLRGNQRALQQDPAEGS